MIPYNPPLIEKRLTHDEMRLLIAKAKARGWITTRTDAEAGPVRFHGKTPYTPRAKGN